MFGTVRPLLTSFLLLCPAVARAAPDAEATPPFLSPQHLLVQGRADGTSMLRLSLLDMARDGTLVSRDAAGIGEVDRIAFSPDGAALYSSAPARHGRGRVISAMRWRNGVATVLNRVTLPGSATGDLLPSPDGRFVLAFDAADASSISMILLRADGGLGAVRRIALPLIGHAGPASVSPDGGVLFVSDAAYDVLRAFRIRPADAVPFSAWTAGEVALPHGIVPGQLVFPPGGGHAYAVSGRGDLLAFALRDNRLSLVQTLPLAAPSGNNPDPVVTPDGRALFVAERGDGGLIASFRLDDDGRATSAGRFPTDGAGPSAIAVDRFGARLLVADAAGGRILGWSINRSTGALAPPVTSSPAVSRPVAIGFTQ